MFGNIHNGIPYSGVGELPRRGTIIKEINRHNGLSTIVIDDANQIAYIYGNVIHENYHQAGKGCESYTVLPIDVAAQQTYKETADEIYEGEFPNNTIQLNFEPSNEPAVFLNGLKQIKGQEYDYVRPATNKIQFNFYDLIPTDKVEVIYDHEV
jgi:hypothetical protein